MVLLSEKRLKLFSTIYFFYRMIVHVKWLDMKEKLNLTSCINLIIKKSSFEKNFLHGYKVKVPNSLLKIFLTISGLSSCPNLSINFALLQSMIFLYSMWLLQLIMKLILKRMVDTFILWILDFTYCLKNKLKMIKKKKKKKLNGTKIIYVIGQSVKFHSHLSPRGEIPSLIEHIRSS